jgi:hypothetical protein
MIRRYGVSILAIVILAILANLDERALDHLDRKHESPAIALRGNK